MTLAPVNLADYSELARLALSDSIWDFLCGGSGDETVLRSNRTALDRISLLPRVLTGITGHSTACTWFTHASEMPVAIAPMAYHKLFNPQGELATARAAKASGVPLIVSTLSSVSIEDIAAVGADLWFQLYWLKDQAQVRSLISRAEDVGCKSIMITADVPLMARRSRDLRNGFALPADVHAANLASGAHLHAVSHTGSAATSAVERHTREAFLSGLSWRHVEQLRAMTTLPIIVKGVMDSRDARLAFESGADCVVVSNHGGRQFDAAPGALEGLANIVEVTPNECSVLFDSGVRTGSDVLKAMALGADGVLLGRPVLWGLAAQGQSGVEQVLALLKGELLDAMTLAGCQTPADAKALAVA
ncbi:alpha-hydroxyacid dehydrogenase, FMN-dependent L-lactate dehydrogenase [Pseudomonas asplenii]|uniref:Alpha-hydroxyacid dehydrogenase, FMN-dependent L-lactate dehydrogenase n=1 Tax=Pseudomonas asplenii TaxID=53407 RepID=A0A0N0E4U2_9PSED|nr:alpha-hydroxy acid oxidase [Pseudomonas fuscovaginae]KPA91716.1 alpha-hydroxyacid dehydrogenase, FMN-dependent L-lactate dehydrogenase [Pseudomonas fuscovaginae]